MEGKTAGTGGRHVGLLESLAGGLAIVECLESSNIFALVGGGPLPKFPVNTVVLWDEDSKKVIAELEFTTDVLDVKLRHEFVIILFYTKVFVYSLCASPVKLFEFDCGWNRQSILSVSWGNQDNVVIAFPSRTLGHVRTVELLSHPHTPITGIITAHTSRIACLSLSIDGGMVASASERGTLIRVFDRKTSCLMHELRRGADYADIYSIAFNSASTRICVASDKGTVHIFNLNHSDSANPQNSTSSSHQQPNSLNNQTARPISRASSSASIRNSAVIQPTNKHQPSEPISTSSNRHSMLSSFSPYLPKYFSSDWSFAHVSIPVECKCILAFGHVSLLSDPVPPTQTDSENAVFVLCTNGGFFVFTFDSRNGGKGCRELFKYIH